MKRISFIITYYNEPLELLRECVESVLSLSLRAEEREILLIDDGSAVPAPAFDGVTVFRQENQGLSAARNKGLELAQSEYIQFLDADDYLFPNAYRHLLDMQLLFRPDVLMFGFTHNVSQEGRLKSVESFSSGIDFLRTRNMRSSACSYLFRKDILGNLRFQRGILHEDELFTPQLLLRAGSLLVADIPAYYYRIGVGTITHQQDAAHIQRRLHDILFVVCELDQLAKVSQGKESEALRRRVSQLSMDCIYNCWMLTRSLKEVRFCLRSLKDNSLYPLPLRCYSLKYWYFALTINCLCAFL